MTRYVEFIERHRKPLIALLVLVNLLSLAGLFRVRIHSDYEVFMTDKSEYRDTLEEMNRVFPGSQQLILMVKVGGPELTDDAVRRLNNVQAFLENVSGVRHVIGPVPGSMFGGTSAQQGAEAAAADLESLKGYYRALGELSPVTEHDGELYATYQVFTGDAFTYKQIDKIEEHLKAEGIEYYISGDTYMQQKLIDYIMMILLILPPTALALVLAVFRSQMGTMKATFLSILPAGIGALWTMGLIGWVGKQVSVITVLAPIFTIVIGSADGLHFVSHVQDERRDGKGDTESVISTLRMVGIPMIITTVTSVAGFLSLLVMNSSAIRDLALFASIGILLAGVATWYVLPLALTASISLRPASRPAGRVVSLGIRRLWGTRSLVILAVLLTLAALGLPKVTTEFNRLMIYRSYTEVHKSFEKISEISGGSTVVFAYVKTDKSPLDPSYAQSILALERELRETSYVGKAVSIYDLYGAIGGLMNRSGASNYPTSLFAAQLIHSVASGMKDSPTSSLINVGERATRVMIFPTDLNNRTLDQIGAKVMAFDEAHPDLGIQVTGEQYLMRELNDSMVGNQAKSLILAFALIFALLYVSLRAFRPSLLSLLPIACTTVILYGFLGWSGISLNAITATIFSITIGVGIDYAIHFTSVWTTFRREGSSSEEAADRAYAYTSRPILANALGLAIGLSALMLSPLRVHLFVSELMWVAMVSAVFLSLSLLPTLLRRTV